MFRKHKKLFYIIIVILGVLLGTQFLVVGKNSVATNLFSFATKPLGEIFSTMGWWTHKKLSFFTNIGNLKKENQELFDKNLSLQSELVKLKEVNRENENFRKELELAPRDKYNLLSALVIGRESGGYSEIIYINRGEKDGVKKDMAVLVNEGILIGRVIDVEKYTSKIRLVIDKDSRVNAQLVDSGGKGLVKGEFGTSMTMSMIPQTIKLQKGEAVVTSNISNYFSAGLLIGYIQNITNSSDQLFQQATVISPVNFDNLHLVWVLINTQDE